MKKSTFMFTFLITFLLFSFVGAKRVQAIVDPLASPNNPFGIHIISEADLDDAANLVNSSGGDWGYVTIVIRKDERDTKRWQEVFNQMRRKHLIPIVRIATRQLNDGWQKPQFDEIDGWVSFLNSLNWVIKNRYVIVGNEVNHASEWGGEIKPEEYARYLEEFSSRLKNENEDFFILQSALDASAPTNGSYLDEISYIEDVLKEKPDIFDYIDGWNSHSYPNPKFTGSQSDTGRGTIRTYLWELDQLKRLGVSKDLPIFITETGWAHDKNAASSVNKTQEEVGENLIGAYSDAWNNPKIVAVTPFLLNYQASPFDIFSWKKPDGTFYSFYETVKNIPKNEGTPVQNTTGEVSILLPPIIRKNESLYGLALIKNTGQSIWYTDKKISLEREGFSFLLDPPLFTNIEPDSKSFFFYQIIR